MFIGNIVQSEYYWQYETTPTNDAEGEKKEAR